jgi:hypothetical protein
MKLLSEMEEITTTITTETTTDTTSAEATTGTTSASTTTTSITDTTTITSTATTTTTSAIAVSAAAAVVNEQETTVAVSSSVATHSGEPSLPRNFNRNIALALPNFSSSQDRLSTLSDNILIIATVIFAALSILILFFISIVILVSC